MAIAYEDARKGRRRGREERAEGVARGCEAGQGVRRGGDEGRWNRWGVARVGLGSNRHLSFATRR